MKANYKIESVVIGKSNFFYLHNFKTLNIIALYGSVTKHDPLTKGDSYVGLWKIKNKK